MTVPTAWPCVRRAHDMRVRPVDTLGGSTCGVAHVGQPHDPRSRYSLRSETRLVTLLLVLPSGVGLRGRSERSGPSNDMKAMRVRPGNKRSRRTRWRPTVRAARFAASGAISARPCVLVRLRMAAESDRLPSGEKHDRCPCAGRSRRRRPDPIGGKQTTVGSVVLLSMS